MNGWKEIMANLHLHQAGWKEEMLNGDICLTGMLCLCQTNGNTHGLVICMCLISSELQL